MSVRRLVNNVPEAYIKTSRDFQLLCNLFDIVLNGVKFDIDTMSTLTLTNLCRDNQLSLLQHKLGFFTDVQISDDVLRIILKGFPYVVKYKGSRLGIEKAINLFMYAMSADDEGHDISITNSADDISGYYVIRLGIKSNSLSNIDILHAILQYIVPSGYFIEYSVQRDLQALNTNAILDGEVKIILLEDDIQGVVYDDQNSTGSFTDNPSVVPVENRGKEGNL